MGSSRTAGAMFDGRFCLLSHMKEVFAVDSEEIYYSNHALGHPGNQDPDEGPGGEGQVTVQPKKRKTKTN